MSRWARPRPWPAPADLPWRQATFAVVDLEATGLDLRRDEVGSGGVVVVRGGRITADRWYQPVRPSRPIDPEAMKLHGLTAAELAQAPTLVDVLPELRTRLRDTTIVAHAAWVERAFLDRALRPLGERLPDGLVDTASLARAAGLAVPDTHAPDLETLARHLGLPVHTPHHALGDALTTAEVLLVLATKLAAARPALGVADLVRASGP